MPPPPKSALIAAVAGAVVGLSALTWGLVALKRRDHAAADDEGTVAPEQWSAAQVIRWLRDNGVSREALAACLRYRVTGEGLLRVTERDLYRMGVPLRDARVILAAVEELREGAALLSRLSQPPMSRQPSIASGSSRQQAAAAPVTTASPGARFEAAFNALVRTCMLHPQDASPAEQQQRVVVYTSALLECFQALSKREQATALALVAAAEDLPSPAPVSASPASLAAEPAAAVPPPAATAADGAFRAVAEKLQPLHSMVDGFLAFLQSPEVAAVSAAEMAELGGRVTEQVRRVVRVCEQLPPEMGGPLLRKCEKVFEVLTARQAGPKREDSAAQQENARAIMRALSDVVAAVRDPGMRDLPAAQRAAALAELVERVEAIEELASGAVEGVPRDEKALQMVQPVLKLLREAVEVSAAEASARAAEDAEAATTPAAGDAAGQTLLSADDIPVVVETIQKVQQTIKSAEFQHAPAAVRAELCAVLSQRIAALEERTGGLPAPTQSAVRELLRNTKAVLAAVGNAATASPPPGAADDEEADEEGDEEADEEDEEKEEAEAAAEEPVGAAGIERYVVQLEKIFEFLTSEALEHAPPQERQKMAEELMQRVDTIKAEIQGSPAEGPIVRDLIDPLYDLLQNMATRQAASPAFVAATAPLREVQGLLDSTSFQQLPHPEKMRIARDVVPQLQQLTAAFAALPPSERAAAEELVRPISEELLRIVRHRPTTGVSAQGVLDRLQGVMRTIQGAEFTTMTPAARSAWAGKAVAELQRLDNDCVALGTEGDALRPIVLRLQGQLQSLFAEEAAAAPATASANGGGAKADVLASVESMRAELAEAERRGASISPARLQQMLRVLTAAAEVADLTAAQEAAVQDFSEGLRRHVEGVTASLDDGAAAGDAAAADAAAEEDALDSLRVSLRTLLELAEEGGGATGAELASLAASAEKFIAAADEAGVQWREDEECAAAVRRLLGLLQQSSATSGEGGDGAEAGEAPSRVEEVLKSSIQALTEAPPATREEFVPFMRVLQLAQPAAEQMTNRELLLLRSLQELIIESMRRLPRPTGEGEEEEEEDEADDAEEGGGDEVDAVLDALLDMSFKLRDGVYSAEQLDEFEAIQQDLEGLLTRAGVDSAEAMASVKEQIRLQRRALSHAAGGDEDNDGDQQEGAETSPLGGEDSRADADAFNEDDDEATSEGVSGPAGATGRSENDEESDE